MDYLTINQKLALGDIQLSGVFPHLDQLKQSTYVFEIDFVDLDVGFIEVKRGRCSALEFSWFAKSFPNDRLTVINANEFETEHVVGTTLAQFLLGE